MRKITTAQVLAENVAYLMSTHSTVTNQNQLARKSSIGQSSISRILRVETQATTDTIEAIARALGVTPAWLLTPREAQSKLIAAEPPAEYNSGRLSDPCFEFAISSTNMDPEFKVGDLVILDPRITPHPGDFVLTRLPSGDTLFAKYRLKETTESDTPTIELHPNNPDFPVIRFDPAKMSLLGTMAEHRRYRRT